MSLASLFSRSRKWRFQKELAPAYRHDEVPEPLRVQVLHILDRALGDWKEFHDKRGPRGPRQAYAIIVETLCNQYGVSVLAGPRTRGARDFRAELWEFLLAERDIDRVLDAIELAFRCVDILGRRFEHLHRDDADDIASDAIAELNARFDEHRVGYRYHRGEIVRVN